MDSTIFQNGLGIGLILLVALAAWKGVPWLVTRWEVQQAKTLELIAANWSADRAAHERAEAERTSSMRDGFTALSARQDRLVEAFTSLDKALAEYVGLLRAERARAGNARE